MQAVKILFVLTSLIIVSLHISAFIFKKKTAEILIYVNIGLHIALVFELMALKVSFEFMALTFMLSLLVYLSSAFVSYKLKMREDGEDDV